MSADYAELEAMLRDIGGLDNAADAIADLRKQRDEALDEINASDLCGRYDAGLSGGGVDIRGDKASIDKVTSAIHNADYLQAVVDELRPRTKAAEARATSLEAQLTEAWAEVERLTREANVLNGMWTDAKRVIDALELMCNRYKALAEGERERCAVALEHMTAINFATSGRAEDKAYVHGKIDAFNEGAALCRALPSSSKED